MFGTRGALLPELFDARRRYIGVSVARETSAVIAGGLAPLVGAGIIALTVRLGGGEGTGVAAWIPIAAYLTLLTLVTLGTTFVTPETRDRDLGDPRDAT